MTRSLIVLSLSLALAACSGDPAQPDPGAGTGPSESANGVATEEQDARTAADPSLALAELPSVLRLDATKLLVEERNYLTRNQAKRRRTTFQFAGPTAEAVAADLRQQLVDAGFKERVNEAVDNGARLGFTRGDVGRVNIRVIGSVEEALLAGATGEAFVDWQLSAAPDTGTPDADAGADEDGASVDGDAEAPAAG